MLAKLRSQVERFKEIADLAAEGFAIINGKYGERLRAAPRGTVWWTSRGGDESEYLLVSPSRRLGAGNLRIQS